MPRSYQELCVALRYGVIMRRVDSTPLEAARALAEVEAKRRYGAMAQTGFYSDRGGGEFWFSIGLYRNGALIGSTVSIRLGREVMSPATHQR